MQAGTLIVERARVPYVVGCVLPSDVIRAGQVKSRMQVRQGSKSVELHVQVDLNGQQHQLQFDLPYASHLEFLHGLTDASALYLLNGTEHPTSRTICNRIRHGGLAIELTDDHKKTSLPN